MFPYLTVLQTHYSLNVSTCLFDLLIVTHPATHLINLLILESNLLKPIILPLYQKLPNTPPLSRLMFCTWKQQFSRFSAVSYILLHLYVFIFILVSHVTHREHHAATCTPSQYYSHLIRLRQHPVLTSRSAFRFTEHSLAEICRTRISHHTQVTGTCHANLTSH